MASVHYNRNWAFKLVLVLYPVRHGTKLTDKMLFRWRWCDEGNRALHIPSSTGLDCSSCSFTLFTSWPLPHTAATYDITSLLASGTHSTTRGQRSHFQMKQDRTPKSPLHHFSQLSFPTPPWSTTATHFLYSQKAKLIPFSPHLIALQWNGKSLNWYRAKSQS